MGYWGMASGAGCVPCQCDSIGALNSSCEDDTGHCYCRPGIGGPRCSLCLPGYYGFSADGCKRKRSSINNTHSKDRCVYRSFFLSLVCDPCNKPGHICDEDTGRCVCPFLTFGENCDRCRSGAYGFIPGIGCKSCACGPGATKSQCNHDGQCSCRDGFDGLRCDRCAMGYYGYPRCRPCACHSSGTSMCGENVCPCNQTGQCPCKVRVAVKIDQH